MGNKLEPITSGKVSIQSELSLRHLIPDKKGSIISQDGVRCREVRKDRRKANKCVTDSFVALLCLALQAHAGSLAALALFKYHDSGTGTVAESAADVGLGTPWGGARDVGTQVQGATANIYKSVATTTYTGTFAITEHGLFNASTGVTLMDRTKFAAVNVANLEKIEFTYQLTISAGG